MVWHDWGYICKAGVIWLDWSTICTVFVIWPDWGNIYTVGVIGPDWGYICTVGVIWPDWGYMCYLIEVIFEEWVYYDQTVIKQVCSRMSLWLAACRTKCWSRTWVEMRKRKIWKSKKYLQILCHSFILSINYCI